MLALRKSNTKTVRRVYLLATSLSFADTSAETVLRRAEMRLAEFLNGLLVREKARWARGVEAWYGLEGGGGGGDGEVLVGSW